MYGRVGSFFENNFPPEQARNILASIARLGLTVPQPSSIRGCLKNNTPDTQLCYNQVNLTDQRELDETIQSLVYDEKEGFWAIASERHFDKVRLPTYQVSEALINSVVFLFSREGQLYSQGGHPDIAVNCWPNMRLCGIPTREEDASYFSEVRVPGKNYAVPPSEMKAILTPLHLVEFVKEFFPGTMVIPVTLLEKTLTEDPIELFVTGKSAKNQTVIGPNFARALHIALAAFPNLNQFGVHLTRLPMVYQPDLSLTLEKNHEIYKKRWDTITLRLSNLRPNQLDALQELHGVRLVKEARNVGTYLCYCSPQQKEAVGECLKQEPVSNTGQAKP
ncbi:hypothetical protein [Legionella tunisiensis]|uniref:hypothetical protein n=1 Tax=Legionella tunisiensis TaxID=1034944 RepID=UPI0002FB725A|nr:hypothetical protein [Legionella tunisiensis]